MISPFARRMCFALSFAAFRATASTADRTTSASYGRLPHGVNTGVYPAMTLTWERPVRLANRFPNIRCSQLRCSTGPPPLNQCFVVFQFPLQHRVGNDKRHRWVNSLALVLAFHWSYILVFVHFNSQVRECPEQQRVSVVIDPLGRQVGLEQLHRS